MTTTPYPYPREKRESDILVGNGTVGPYGPSTFKIFDIVDVAVLMKKLGEDRFSDVTLDATVSKSTGAPFDTFSVTFDNPVLATSEFVFQSRRMHERETAVTKGGAISSNELEKELSKQGTVLEEARRDIDRALAFQPGYDGDPRLPAPAADKMIGWNSTATRLENKTALQLGLVEVVNEPDMASNSPTKVPTQQSVKAHFETVGTVTASGGSVARTLPARFSDALNVKDFGALGSGVADDTAAITAAQIAGATYVPAGIYDTTIGQSALTGPFRGPGQIRTSDDNKRAPHFNAISSEPSRGDYGSVLTFFNGDYSKVPFAVEHRITGAATLGQPVTGYMYTPEATPHVTYVHNSSGHNQGTSDNVGRTAATAYRTIMTHVGQGDCMAYNFSVFVDSAKAGATHFLANPAGTGLAGEIIAGRDGVYLNPMEINLNGGPHDVAAVGVVYNMDRNDATAALGEIWNGVRVQSIGASDIDSALFLSGKARLGVDLVHATFGSDKAAIALKADDKIYGNATADPRSVKSKPVFGDEWFGYSSTELGWVFASNGVPALLAKAGHATPANYVGVQSREVGIPPIIEALGSDTDINMILRTKGFGLFSMRTGGAGGPTQFEISATASAVNNLRATGAVTTGTPVLSAQGTDTDISGQLLGKGTGGWEFRDGAAARKFQYNTTGIGFFNATPAARGALAAPTGTITRTTFATSTVTLPQLAERVYAMINDLRAYGLFS